MDNQNFQIEKLILPKWEEIPNIDLYMDQIITYLDDSLCNIIKNDKTDKSDKIITKTMINNYVKQNIIPAPNNKKYNKIHIAELIVICILKEVYCISDIKKLIDLALYTADIHLAYNRFCSYFESCIQSTFTGKSLTSDTSLTNEQFLLKTVVQSYVNKLYVQTTYLNTNS